MRSDETRLPCARMQADLVAKIQADPNTVCMYAGLDPATHMAPS